MTRRERCVSKLTQVVASTGDEDMRILAALLADIPDELFDGMLRAYEKRKTFVRDAAAEMRRMLAGK